MSMRNETAVPSAPTVLVTRPVGQAEPLCDLLAVAGYRPFRLPVLDIEFLADSEVFPEELANGVQSLDGHDLLIFTSVNAVEGLERALQRADLVWPERMPELAAIGAATADRLMASGLPVGIRPTGPYTSEGLLALPRLHAVSGQRVLLVGGVGGRGLIADALTERGASVAVLDVYRRNPHPHPVGGLEAVLREQAPQAVIVTSVEGLEQLVAFASDQDQRDALFGLGVVTVSPRVARAARQQGFRAGVVVADEASDQALVAALERWRGSPSSNREHATEATVASGAEDRGARRVGTPPVAEPARGPRARGGLAAVVPAALVLVLAAAGSGWLWLQQQSLLEGQRLLEQRIERFAEADASTTAGLSQFRDSVGGQIARSEARIDQLTLEQQSQVQHLARAEAAVSQGRDAQARLASQMERVERLASAQQVDWVIAESRYLYRVARARLLFNADLDGALAALADAETLLADVGAEGLDMRRRVQAATRAILDLPTGNRQEMTGALQRLALDVGNWPLRVPVQPLVADPIDREHDADLSTLDGWWAAASRTWDRIGSSLSGLVVVRRDLAPPPLLAPSEEWFLRENIRLQLLTARLAVLEADQETFGLSLEQAAYWIGAYFSGSEAADRALERINALGVISISLPTLDIDSVQVDADAMGGRR
jgi:uroporphyrinogen-III synthase/uncharacterized protein HemX